MCDNTRRSDDSMVMYSIKGCAEYASCSAVCARGSFRMSKSEVSRARDRERAVPSRSISRLFSFSNSRYELAIAVVPIRLMIKIAPIRSFVRIFIVCVEGRLLFKHSEKAFCLVCSIVRALLGRVCCRQTCSSVVSGLLVHLVRTVLLLFLSAVSGLSVSG